METWDLYLESWVTMDWGYDDVARGEIIESPLRLSADRMTQTCEAQKRIERIPNRSRRYRVVGEVTAIWNHLWQIDFGLRAVSASPLPTGVTRGSYVAGEIALGIDYPNNWLGYRWFIESITKESAPLVPVDDEIWMQQHPKYRIPVLTRMTSAEIERTDGYGDGLLKDIQIMYILHCRRMDGEERH